MTEQTEAEFLASYDPSKYPIITVTVDMVVLGMVGAVPHVLLIERAQHPFKGYWALPGGFINPDETSLEAAVRELREEAGLDVRAEDVVPMCVADKPDRDPRGRAISIVYTVGVSGALPEVYAGDDARHAEWVPLADARKGRLAFDHNKILEPPA
jgi:8-oxo-dGTP diphosphatase